MDKGYTQRQYKRMFQLLEGYVQKKMGLGTLITNIEGLLKLLENEGNSEWLEEFRKSWATLDDIYGIAASDNRPVSETGLRLIEQSIREMQIYLQEVMTNEED